jgi:CubicO group peptidase (beta-lactamase class C family)
MVIDWEAANAKNYTVEGSNDSTFATKTTLKTQTNMASVQHRIDSLTGLTGSYRYYRVYGTARNLTYGYSIWEARLYSQSGNQPPVANAGSDQTVSIGTSVTLDGRLSQDPDNGPLPLTFSWVQTAGAAVTLTGATTAQPTFTPASAGTYTFRLTVSDGAATSFDDIIVTVSGTSPLAFAVNCGGPQFTAFDGTVYGADNSFTGGSISSTTNLITNTNDPMLYQTERYGICDYIIPGLPNGNYSITFKFAETYWSAAKARVFDVQAENQTLLSQLDIYSLVGKNRACDTTKVVQVTDGDLHIKFMNATADQPEIRAIMVTRAYGLKNGTFETSAAAQPMLWTAFSSNNAQATMTWEPVGSGHKAGRCVAISHASGNDSYWEQTVYGLVPGTTYFLRGYVKGTNIVNTTGSVGANLCLTDGSASTRNAVLTGTFDWKPVSVSFVAPVSGTVTVGARLGFTGGTATGNAEFDDITLTPTTGRIDASMASVDSIMNSFMADNAVPGGALGIVKDGRLVYARGFGYADKEAGQPVQPNSLFRLASVSKSVTSVALMNLIQGNKLGIDAKVFGSSGILSDAAYSPLLDAQVAQITARQMMQHISGWGGTDPMFDNNYIAQAMGVPMPVGPQTIISYMVRNVGLTYAPGSTYNYFNFNYCVLGRVIEKISGMAYYDYLNSAILTPLGISDIKLGRNLLSNRLPNEVKYYDYDTAGSAPSIYDATKMVPAPYGGYDLEAMDSHGGLIASAPALLKLLVAVDGFNTKPDILNASTIQLMTTPSSPNPNYACGWAVNSAGNWWHIGDLPGTVTEIVRASNGLSWVFLFNTRPKDIGDFDSGVDNLGWQAVNSVSSWPTDDQFSQFK